MLSDRAVDRLLTLVGEPDTEGTRYRVRSLLGRGGMSAVYLAHDEILDRDVALKVLEGPLMPDHERPDAVRLRQEARILAHLEHPGIAPIHDYGELPDGRPYYAMKRVRGERFDVWAARASLHQRLDAFRRLCEAVAFAHAHRVIHRDLKPANVMVGAFGEVLVLDWGVARWSHSAAAVHDPAGTVVGTPSFMAPEQAAGDLDRVDQRADVYALGRILATIAEGDVLAAIVAKACSTDPDARYPGAAELMADVARFQEGAAVSAHRESFWSRASRLARRHRVALGLVVAYVIMRAALLFILRR